MLVLTRKLQEKIHIGENITITVVRIKGNTVRVGIEAPGDMRVLRGEVLLRDETGTASVSSVSCEAQTTPPPAPQPCREPCREPSSPSCRNAHQQPAMHRRSPLASITARKSRLRLAAVEAHLDVPSAVRDASDASTPHPALTC